MKWKAKDYCPPQLRSVAAVLADARPARMDDGTFRWWCGGSDWWGVEPPAGVIPSEIATRMPRRDKFASEDEAMGVLRKACDGLILDGFGRAV